MAVNVVDTNPIVDVWPPLDPIVDPVYSGFTGNGGTTIRDIGTVSVLDFGNPIIDTTTGGGTTGVVTPVILTDSGVDIKYNIDPCLKFLIAGRMINTVTSTGVTNTFAPYFNGVSGNIFDLSNVTGHTATGITAVYKNTVIKPGYTIYFKDVYGNLNNGGPVLLPNRADIISGATVYVNGVSIMNQDYRPFKVKFGTYLLTFISADYTNKQFFYSLTGDIVPSTEKPITSILQDNFTQISPTRLYYEQQNYYNAAIIELNHDQLFGTIKYDVDMIIQNTEGQYYQKGQPYTTLWADISLWPISDIYAIKLPVLGLYDRGLTFKFTIKQFVSTNANTRLLIYSDTDRIISPYQKTYDSILAVYLIEMNTAETIELYFDGYDYIVTNMNKQPYMRISETPLSSKDQNMAANNYVETNLDNLIG